MLNFLRDNSRILSKLLFYQFGAAFFSGMMILAVPDNSTTLGLVIGIFCAFFLVFLNHIVLWEEGATCRLRADAGRAAYNPLKGLYLMLAVNRRYGRSDYLPCIAWGIGAAEAREWEVGRKISLVGRLQSRKYIKQEDGRSVEKTAFEVSVTEFR